MAFYLLLVAAPKIFRPSYGPGEGKAVTRQAKRHGRKWNERRSFYIMRWEGGGVKRRRHDPMAIIGEPKGAFVPPPNFEGSFNPMPTGGGGQIMWRSQETTPWSHGNHRWALWFIGVHEFMIFKWFKIWLEPIWKKVNTQLLLPQHQSTYPRGPESASIKIPPFRPHCIKFSKKKFIK